MGLLAALSQWSAAQTTTPITLDTNETLFVVLTAINTCGYDQDLPISDPLRSQIRAEVQKNLGTSEEAQSAMSSMCEFYLASRRRDATHDLAQYVSLALYLQGPPQFLPKVKEDLMPPDAANITGFGPLLEKFNDKAGLHGIWERRSSLPIKHCSIWQRKATSRR